MVASSLVRSVAVVSLRAWQEPFVALSGDARPLDGEAT